MERTPVARAASKPAVFDADQLSEMTVKELRQAAKDFGLTGRRSSPRAISSTIVSADGRLRTTLIIDALDDPELTQEFGCIVSTEPDPEDECVYVAIETGEVFITTMSGSDTAARQYAPSGSSERGRPAEWRSARRKEQRTSSYRPTLYSP